MDTIKHVPVSTWMYQVNTWLYTIICVEFDSKILQMAPFVSKVAHACQISALYTEMALGLKLVIKNQTQS